jgi:hypothetical protein
MGISAVGPATPPAGGGPNDITVGEKLFEWNGVDFSQFDAAMAEWDNAIGGIPNADSAITRSVVADPVIPARGNVMQMAAVALQGHGGLLVKASELTLPQRYIIELQLVDDLAAPTQFPFAGVLAFFKDSGATTGGFGIVRQAPLSTLAGWAIINDAVPATANVNYASGGSFNAATVLRGGANMRTVVHQRPMGEPTAFSVVTHHDWIPSFGEGHGTELPHSITGVGANWNGQDMDRCGIWLGETSNFTTGTFQFGKFAVYAHPDD